MLWESTWHKRLKFYDALEREGRLAPAHVRPDMTGCAWLVEAYADLSTCRALGFGGVGPIPITALWQYVDRHDLPEWCVDVWRAVDRYFLHMIDDEKATQ